MNGYYPVPSNSAEAAYIDVIKFVQYLAELWHTFGGGY